MIYYFSFSKDFFAALAEDSNCKVSSIFNYVKLYTSSVSLLASRARFSDLKSAIRTRSYNAEISRLSIVISSMDAFNRAFVV